MIREATEADLPTLVDMCMRFCAKLPTITGMDFMNGDEASIHKTLVFSMTSETSGVWVSEEKGIVKSMAVAVVYPCLFNGKLLGQEIAWWAEPGAREARNLRRHMESWALSKGAVAFQMLRLVGMRDAALDRVYCHDGYRPVEAMYIKGLGDGNRNGNSNFGGGGS